MIALYVILAIIIFDLVFVGVLLYATRNRKPINRKAHK